MGDDEEDPNIELRAALIAAAESKTLEAVVTEKGVDLAELLAADGVMEGIGIVVLAAAVLLDDRDGLEYLIGSIADPVPDEEGNTPEPKATSKTQPLSFPLG